MSFFLFFPSALRQSRAEAICTNMISNPQNMSTLLSTANKIGRNILIFLLVFSWIFSGWPQLPYTDFPPKAEMAQAAITFDNASSSDTGSGTAASLTWSHAVGSECVDSCILIVGASIRNSSSQTVSSITYGGVSMTATSTVTNSTNVRAEMWYLVNPPRGTSNVVVTLSAAARFVGGAYSYYGIEPTSPFGKGATATGNTTTPTVDVSHPSGEFGRFRAYQ